LNVVSHGLWPSTAGNSGSSWRREDDGGDGGGVSDIGSIVGGCAPTVGGARHIFSSAVCTVPVRSGLYLSTSMRSTASSMLSSPVQFGCSGAVLGRTVGRGGVHSRSASAKSLELARWSTLWLLAVDDRHLCDLLRTQVGFEIQWRWRKLMDQSCSTTVTWQTHLGYEETGRMGHFSFGTFLYFSTQIFVSYTAPYSSQRGHSSSSQI